MPCTLWARGVGTVRSGGIGARDAINRPYIVVIVVVVVVAGGSPIIIIIGLPPL